MKYTPEGGSISLKVYEDTELQVKDHFASLCFVISDTGNGIKKEFIPQLFNAFTREQEDDENAATSMGLGLSIAQKLIHSMNGEITVESEVGKGSTFIIHLLLEKCDGVRNKKHDYEKDAIIPLKGYNVLIAEDNELNRTILGALLASEGITYVEAENGELAFNEFVKEPAFTYDCILMDMRMPIMNGIQATESIRNSEKEDAKLIPIIAVSANGFGEDVEKAKRAGVNEYTTKPIDRDKLFATLRRLLK